MFYADGWAKTIALERERERDKWVGQTVTENDEKCNRTPISLGIVRITRDHRWFGYVLPCFQAAWLSGRL